MLPNDLLSRITTDDLVEQMAFYELEPFGALVEERRMGQLMSLTANINRNTEVKSTPWTPEDFMPSLAAESERQNQRQTRTSRRLTAKQASDLMDVNLFGVTPSEVPRSRKPWRVKQR